MNSGILSHVITIFYLLSQVRCIRPNVFIPVSNATCQPEYAWMNNAQQRSPCLAVAYVIAACVGDTWTQPALPSGYSYDTPNGTTATPCYCSWSCYNLMMACTLCQNPAYTSEITTWPSFSQNCPSSYKDAVFPQGYVLANDASIPYWATIDPTTWPSELFNIGQAENYANQNNSDYWPSSSSSSSSGSGSSANIGAIVGGTIGGVVALLAFLFGGYVLYKHKLQHRVHDSEMSNPMTTMLTHPRWISGPPAFSPTLTNSPPMSRTTSQPQGAGSASSIVPQTPYSYSSFRVPSPPVETSSYLTTGNTMLQHTRAIPIV